MSARKTLNGLKESRRNLMEAYQKIKANQPEKARENAVNHQKGSNPLVVFGRDKDCILGADGQVRLIK